MLAERYRVRDDAMTSNAIQADGVITPVNTVGDRIAWARAERKLTQAELARRAGVSQSAIASYEAGHRGRPRELPSIARALDASVDWLDTGEGDWEAAPSMESRLEEMFVEIIESTPGMQARKLTAADAARLPDWLRYAFRDKGQHLYIPDFELYLPGRRTPLWIEVKAKGLFNSFVAMPLQILAREHPGDFAVFFAEYRKPRLAVDEFLEQFGRTRPKDSDFDGVPVLARGGQDNDLPQFSLKRAAPIYPTMQPILSWQHEDELPEGEFVMVPRLQVHLSAGGGAGTSQVEIQFDEAQPQAFRAEWVRSQHLKPKKLAAMTARGDSMEPTIHDGDSLLVDTGQVEVLDGKVYALWWDGGERVKRLYRMPGGGLRIRSDNATDFPEIVLGPEHPGHVRIIGRVVHRSGTGGL